MLAISIHEDYRATLCGPNAGLQRSAITFVVGMRNYARAGSGSTVRSTVIGSVVYHNKLKAVSDLSKCSKKASHDIENRTFFSERGNHYGEIKMHKT